jgi:hypothetical protein
MNTKEMNIEQVSEVIAIKRMFEHIHKSAYLLKYPKNNLKFFGFPENTIHYEIFRTIVLNELEISMNWRYRDQDTDGVLRCQLLLRVYKFITTDNSRVNQEPLNKHQLDRLDAVSLSLEQVA